MKEKCGNESLKIALVLALPQSPLDAEPKWRWRSWVPYCSSSSSLGIV